MNAEEPTYDELADALRRWASGYLTLAAAVELLVRHDIWLHREDFLSEAVNVVDAGVATIDWKTAIVALDAGRFPCTGSEADMLRIVCSLAEKTPVFLGRALTSLDGRNIALMVAAMKHASGGRDAWRGL